MTPEQREQIIDVVTSPHPCESWHRKMFAYSKATDKKHVTCGRPWKEHGGRLLPSRGQP